MPYVDRGEARIWYTEQGTGFPVLTLAPGGMRSSVPMWEMAAINPLTAYAGQYQMIAMDQRNAGQDPYDRRLTDLIGELCTRSEDFRVRWAGAGRAGPSHG